MKGIKGRTMTQFLQKRFIEERGIIHSVQLMTATTAMAPETWGRLTEMHKSAPRDLLTTSNHTLTHHSINITKQQRSCRYYTFIYKLISLVQL